MGTFEDLRTLAQDFIVPEFKEMAARVSAVEKNVDRLEKHMERRFNEVETKINQLIVFNEAKTF